MQIIKCKNCGAQLDITKAIGGVVDCDYCHSKHTLSKSIDSKAAEFLRMGEHDLDARKFNDAYLAFSKAAECDKTEPEAYFGMALAQHQVQYIKDVKNDRLQPICHDVSDKIFEKNKNYSVALDVATAQQREEYIRRAKEIDYIRNEFYKLKQSGMDYDCFICVKVSGENGHKTIDSERANDIYYHLKDKGYRPFYSEREIQNEMGADYEARILYALFSSPCMLIVCSDESYLQTPWVKNEYSRFISLINDEQKEANSIAIGFFDTPIERLPGRNGRLQGVCLKNPDAYSKIVDFVELHYQINAQAPQIARKTYEHTYQKKTVIKSQVQKRTLATFAQTELSISEQSKLNATKNLLDSGEFTAVVSRCTALLESNKSCSEAYWYLFLAKNNCRNTDEFITSVNKIDGFDILEAAIATGNENVKNEYYAALFNRAKRDRKLYIYNEYVSLPESETNEISELTELVYQDLLKGSLYDSSSIIFDAIIKTVEDTEKYLEMNLGFADRLFYYGSMGDASKYYAKALECDPSSQRALWQVFVIKNALYSDIKILDYLSNGSNNSYIEKELYGYGFNEFATEKLFNVSIHAIGNSNYRFEWLDYLFSLIPSTKEDIYLHHLNKVVDKFLSTGMFLLASKYNDMIISADKFNDKAYLNRVCISHKVRNTSGLMNACDTLYDDVDFAKAIDVYAERNIGVPNKYIQLVNQLKNEKIQYEKRMTIEKEQREQRERKEKFEKEQREKREKIEKEERARRERIEQEERARAAAAARRDMVKDKISETIQWIAFLLPTAIMSVIMLIAFIAPTTIFHNVHFGWSIGLYIAVTVVVWIIAIASYNNFGMLEFEGGKLAIVLLSNLVPLVLLIIRLVTLSYGTFNIRSVYDFEAIDNMPTPVTYKLLKDLDFEDNEVTPIDELPEGCTFDGNGHTISNIVFAETCDITDMVSSDDYSYGSTYYASGLFAICKGTIQNLTIKNVTIRIEQEGGTVNNTGDSLYLGAIAGALYGGTIKDCDVVYCEVDLSKSKNFNIPGEKYGLPGLCAFNYTYKEGKIEDCDVTGYTYKAQKS